MIGIHINQAAADLCLGPPCYCESIHTCGADWMDATPSLTKDALKCIFEIEQLESKASGHGKV